MSQKTLKRAKNAGHAASESAENRSGVCSKEPTLTRRTFIGGAAALGGGAFLLSQFHWALDLVQRAEAGTLTSEEYAELRKAENILHTVCLQCNTGCGIRVRLLNGTAVKVDGNPYSPWTMEPHLPYRTPLGESLPLDGHICLKGQAGLQTVYDPYRLRKVLKRAGPRGSNQWVTIPFDQAIDEIVNGGKLFANVPGEENRVVTGLKDIYALRDPKIAKEMAADVDKIRSKQMSVAEFKERWKDHLHLLMDPDHPDFGPKNNALVFSWGRLKGGRSTLISRFTTDGFGSVNAHGHTTVCQGSLYFTGKAMSEKWQYDEKKGKVSWSGGSKFYWQADLSGAEFVIFVGASPLEANYPPYRSGKITDGLVDGRLKIVVVDPRLSKTAAKAWKWIPAKPGTEGALALALIQWIIANRAYNEGYLRCANKAAAGAAGEPNWTNATWLVKIERDHPTAFLRASEIGIPPEKRTTKDGKEYEYDRFVALVNGVPSAVDPYDEKNAVVGDLFVDTSLSGIPVKSVMTLLSEKTLEEWAQICDVDPEDIREIAREFASHGRRSVADIHRGVSQHTNGYYNVQAWYSLNLLVGNFDWKGGLSKPTTYDPEGGKDGQPYPVGKMHPGKAVPFGLSIIRHDAKYEESTLFSGYPAKRGWFPLSSDIYQEIYPSIADAYPYPIKALISYMGAANYALPAGHKIIEVLTDLNKLPLFIACDIVVGVHSMYADYIFPDLSYLERWEFHGSHPTVVQKVQPVRNPVIAPLTETVKVYGMEMPLSLEALLLAIAERLNLPGFGPDGFGPNNPLTHPDHLYLKMVSNLAFGEKADGSDAVPDAPDEEVDIFLKARRHLPKSVFDPERWKSICGESLWRKVIFVLNRGGRFQDYEASWENNLLKNRYGTLINMYCEKTAKTKDPFTGKSFSGVARYVPVADVLGQPLAKDGYDLHLITHREIFQTKSRTSTNYWLLEAYPENEILINSVDAQRLNLKDGDRARIISPSNPEGVWDLKNGRKIPIIGRVRVLEGMRPGVISFALGFGNWANHSSDIVVDGVTIKGDPRRFVGFHANAAMAIDPFLKNTPLEDVVGGSVSFYDSPVRLVKV